MDDCKMYDQKQRMSKRIRCFYSRKIGFVILVLLMCLQPVGAQQVPISLLVMPGAVIPLGPELSDGTDMYSIGASVAVEAAYTFPAVKALSANAYLAYELVPTTADKRLSLISAGVGPGFTFSPFSKLALKLSLIGGYSQGLYKDLTGGNMFIVGEAMASYTLTPQLSLAIGSSYRHFLGRGTGSLTTLYNGIGVSVGTSINLGSGQHRSRIEIQEIELLPLFPVFFKFYDDNPVGKIVVRNGEKRSIENVRVTFFVEQYMDEPKLCAIVPEMERGEIREISLFALFNEKILDITEATKTAAQVRIDYDLTNLELTNISGETMRIFDRNAMTWDDDRKAASFVTAKDPTVLQLAKNVASLIRQEGTSIINTNFRCALALFRAMSLLGVNYVVDPKTPYAELSESVNSIDYLQFPKQTLVYKAGDCDDLSILYAALLEAIGIETAFITVPGHIYTAFALDLTPQEAAEVFSKPEDLIEIDGSVWIPVEITMVQDDFLKAWETGASQWRKHRETGNAALVPIHEAWKRYEPVGLSLDDTRVSLPPDNAVREAYDKDLAKFVNREIGPRVAQLQDRIDRSNGSPALVNKLGTLYARYGLLDKAKEQFQKLVGSSPYLPALVNLGNIYYLEQNMNSALQYYGQALRQEPDNIKALVGMSLVHYEREDFTAARESFHKIEELDPKVAARYAFIAGSGEGSESRASAVGREERMLWEEW